MIRYKVVSTAQIDNVNTYPSVDSTAFDSCFVFPIDSNGNLLPQPVIPGSNGTLTQEIFTVTAPAGIALGDYSGVFAFQGGTGTDISDPANMTNLGSVAFTVRGVTPQQAVPEPGSIVWLICFGKGVVCLTRRRVCAAK